MLLAGDAEQALAVIGQDAGDRLAIIGISAANKTEVDNLDLK